MLARRVNGHPVDRLKDEMERLFDNFFGDSSLTGTFGARTFPALNIWDQDENIFVEAELPGMKMEDLSVLVSGKELTIEGQRGEDNGQSSAYHRRERMTGRFRRNVQLPVEINADKVSAQLNNGVLLITLPKAEQVRPRKIEVRSLNR